MNCSPPGSSVHGIFQAEYWSGLSFPPPGVLPNPGIETESPALQSDSLPLSHWGGPEYDIRDGFYIGTLYKVSGVLSCS